MTFSSGQAQDELTVGKAFGPSELCFNALNFVIQAWQGYQGIFEELAGLLEKCAEYLGRLEYHVHAGMDAKLSKVACQHLLLFVEICDRTVKLRSRRRKLLAVVKILFLQDNGGHGSARQDAGPRR